MSASSSKQAIALNFKRWLDIGAVFLDTETTGLRTHDRIIEIAVLDTAGGVLLHSLVNPKKDITKAATAVHGIVQEQVADAPTFDSVLPRILDIVRGKTVVIYNADFDLRVMNQSLAGSAEKLKKVATVVDAMKPFAEFIEPNGRWQTLENAARLMQIAIHKPTHSATMDADLCRRLIHAVAADARADSAELPAATIAEPVDLGQAAKTTTGGPSTNLLARIIGGFWRSGVIGKLYVIGGAAVTFACICGMLTSALSANPVKSRLASTVTKPSTKAPLFESQPTKIQPSITPRPSRTAPPAPSSTPIPDTPEPTQTLAPPTETIAPTATRAQATRLIRPTRTPRPNRTPRPIIPTDTPEPATESFGLLGAKTDDQAGGGACDPSYPTVCIPPAPPDLDCPDVSYRNFDVLPPDPHRFDRDKDGKGCEN